MSFGRQKVKMFSTMTSSLLGSLKKGERYEIYTKVKEVPVKTILQLNWIDKSTGLVGFDWGNCTRKGAFQPGSNAYIKLSEETFLKSKVISNKQELVLEPTEECEKPEFLKRRAVRVEVDPLNPVKVKLKVGDKEYQTEAKDISETGVGIVVRRDTQEGQEILNLLEKKENELIDLDLELPKYGHVHSKGRVGNKEIHDNEVYIRFGFELDMTEEHKAKVRRYVLERQQEIIKSLSLL